MANETQLWTDKYAPMAKEEFVGNSEALEAALKWSHAWCAGKREKPLLVHGHCGTGKTALAYLIARLSGWELFEMNASDFRTKEIVEKIAGSAAQGATFSGKLRMVLIDEVDGIHGAADRGGAGAVLQVIKESGNPVALTADDVYAPNLRSIRAYCTLVEFKKINYLSVAKRLREILDAEGVAYDADAVKTLAQNSSGDFRSALLDAQALVSGGKITMEGVQSLGYRDRSEKIFKVLMEIFNGKNFSEIRRAGASAELSLDLLERWIEENIPRHYTKVEDSASAMERLSRADVFNGRIMRRQHYGFMRYSSDLMTAGVALSRSSDYPGFVSYQFPTLLSKLSRSKSVRGLKKGLAAKIGKALHSSSREVMSADMPYLQMLMENRDFAVLAAARFDLNGDELAFLLGTKPETKKVEKLLEEAQALRAQHMKARRKQPGAFVAGYSETEERKGTPTQAASAAPGESARPEQELHGKSEKGQTSLSGYAKQHFGN